VSDPVLVRQAQPVGPVEQFSGRRRAERFEYTADTIASGGNSAGLPPFVDSFGVQCTLAVRGEFQGQSHGVEDLARGTRAAGLGIIFERKDRMVPAHDQFAWHASAPFIYVGNYFIVTVSYGVTLKNAFHSTFTFDDAGCSGYKKRIHPHQSSFIFSVNRDFLAEWIRCFLGTWRMSETTFQAITRLAGFVRPVPESEPRPAVRLVPAGWRASAVG